MISEQTRLQGIVGRCSIRADGPGRVMSSTPARGPTSVFDEYPFKWGKNIWMWTTLDIFSQPCCNFNCAIFATFQSMFVICRNGEGYPKPRCTWPTIGPTSPNWCSHRMHDAGDNQQRRSWHHGTPWCTMAPAAGGENGENGSLARAGQPIQLDDSARHSTLIAWNPLSTSPGEDIEKADWEIWSSAAAFKLLQI